MMDLLKQREEHIFNRTGVDSKKRQSETVTNIKTVNPSQTPQPTAMITNGICTNCENLGPCVWQHNNKFNCQHYH